MRHSHPPADDDEDAYTVAIVVRPASRQISQPLVTWRLHNGEMFIFSLRSGLCQDSVGHGRGPVFTLSSRAGTSYRCILAIPKFPIGPAHEDNPHIPVPIVWAGAPARDPLNSLLARLLYRSACQGRDEGGTPGDSTGHSTRRAIDDGHAEATHGGALKRGEGTAGRDGAHGGLVAACDGACMRQSSLPGRVLCAYQPQAQRQRSPACREQAP